MTAGGTPQGVHLITDSDLKVNGGKFAIQPGPAMPIASLATADRGVLGGNPIFVYEIDAASLPARGLMGGEPVPITDITSAGRGATGPLIAIPVYVVSGSLGGGAVTPPAPSVQYIHEIASHWNANVSNDLDTVWNYLNGISGSTDTDMYADDGSFAPALSRAAVAVQKPDSMSAIGADQWVSWQCFGDQLGAVSSDWMGMSLRTSITDDDYYCFWHQSANYELFKVVSGAKTNLATGVLSPVSATFDTYRFEVEGTALRVYRNDVLLDSATDSAITAANDGMGIQASGFEINLRAGRIKYGEMPYDTTNHVYVHGGWRSNIYGDLLAPGSPNTQVIDACAGWLFTHNTDSQGAVTGSGHSGSPEPPHFFTWDMGEKIKFSRIRTWGDAGVANKHDWSDVDIEVSDDNVAWTTVATGVAFDNVNANGWKYSPRFDTDAEARYMRVTINATLHASNHVETEEVEIWSGFEDDLWWLSDTVTHLDCWSAYRMKGVLSYWCSRANANSVENGLNRRLEEVIGVVPWTSAGGLAFDGTNYMNARYTADGADHTIIARFSGADGTGTLPVLGDGVGPGGIAVIGATATSILVSNQSFGDIINVASVAQDMTIAMAGDQYYLDGASQGTLTSYSAAAGSQTIKLGGVHGVPGSGTMVAAAIYNRKLTATEVANITTRIQAL